VRRARVVAMMADVDPGGMALAHREPRTAACHVNRHVRSAGVSDPPGPGGRALAAFGRGVAHAPAALRRSIPGGDSGLGRQKPPPLYESPQVSPPLKDTNTLRRPKRVRAFAIGHVITIRGRGNTPSERPFPSAFPLLDPDDGRLRGARPRASAKRVSESTIASGMVDGSKG